MSLNEQKAPYGIEWTRVWGRPGFTLNPIRGCTHDCKWRMPDGFIAGCYAKAVAEGPAKSAYPGGFENVRFLPDELAELDRKKLSEPAGIFIGSMSDLFGVGTKPEWTDLVLDSVHAHPQHVFFSLTKNPPRLLRHQLPANLWVGISAPANFMFGKELTEAQQLAWFENALKAMESLKAPQCQSRVKWLSLEPLTIDLSPLLERYRDVFQWVVIGAASAGRRTHQPDKNVFARTLAAIWPKPVFFKGNVDRKLAEQVAGRWLADFPDQHAISRILSGETWRHLCV